ncbi:hypothetical protein O181_039415 [Austropuccinia psidii MF-1]|uniref:Uncharacterized protein n=1 Tax=Austropuccinia psidii MF-1 TaxID=1389203 RepID=A0A9Q3DEV5_9BASI|nr:hypothetical protein [Austropuccinia psidii MF-1]
MEHGQQEVQPGIPLGRTWSKLPEDLSQSDELQRPYGNKKRLESHQEVQFTGGEGKQDKVESSHYSCYRRTADLDRAYSDSLRIKRRRPNQLSSGFRQFRKQQIIGQESPSFTIPGSFHENTRKQGKKQDHIQPEEERVRPIDPEAVRFGERSAEEPEAVVNNSRMSSPINKNNTPTQIDHNVVTHESNVKSDALWLQMSQFSEKTQKQFLAKNLEEGNSQLSKASVETNKILNLVFEEQHNRKRDRDCLDQEMKKINFYHNMKP